jgi:hypothetical protein
MGSTANSPADEYDQAATFIVVEMVACPTRDEVEAVVHHTYSNATQSLVDCLWLALTEYRST